MEHDWKTLQAPAKARHHGDVRTWRCRRCGASVTVSSSVDVRTAGRTALGGADPDCDVELARRVMKS